MADYLYPYSLIRPGDIPDSIRVGGVIDTPGTGSIDLAYFPEDVFMVVYTTNTGVDKRCIVNFSNYPFGSYKGIVTYSVNNYVITNGYNYRQLSSQTANKGQVTGNSNALSQNVVGMCIYAGVQLSNASILAYAQDNNPWKVSGVVPIQIPVRWKGLEDTFEITVK